MKTILSTLLIALSVSGYAQSAEEAEQKGKLLYRLEKASWNATDHFLGLSDSIKDSVGGYLSYVNPDNTVSTIFYNRYEPNQIIRKYVFDSLPQVDPISVESKKLMANDLEQQLISIRRNALISVNQDQDGFYRFYEKASLNFIPLIQGGKKQVYILTGPHESGVVLIGNDYLLEFDKHDQLKSKVRIHNSLIRLTANSEDPENKLTQSFHSHVLTDLISETDICTLLLYKDFVEWKQHLVISKKMVSIFDMEKESLFTMTRKAWDKVYARKEK